MIGMCARCGNKHRITARDTNDHSPCPPSVTEVRRKQAEQWLRTCPVPSLYVNDPEFHAWVKGAMRLIQDTDERVVVPDKEHRRWREAAKQMIEWPASE